MLLGHMTGKPSLLKAARILISRRHSHRVAVQQFLSACRRKPSRRLIRLNNLLHVAVFAPSGAGKNVSIVGPMLLTCEENCITLDPKGENCRLSSEYREKAFGHKIIRLDPFRLTTDTPDSFNVLDTIDASDPESFDYIRAIAEALVIKEPNARDPHWVEKAQTFIYGAILAVIHLCPPERRSLQDVAEIMADKAILATAIQAMKRSTVHGGLLARAGSEMSISTDKELDGILSTANRSLSFLGTPDVVESTRAIRGFDPKELNDKSVSVYMIIPAIYLRSHAALLRLWVTALTRSIVSRGVENPRPVNLILDECACMGRLEALEDLLTMGRGFGLKITAIFQSMSQLKKVFPEGQEGVLLGNTTQVFFAVQEVETAKYINERLGKFTDVISSGGTSNSSSYQSSPQSGQGSSSTSTSQNSNWQLSARELLQVDEILNIHPRVAITFHPGTRPICTFLSRFYEKNFNTETGTGLWRSAFDTACLFLTAAMIAFITTAVFFQR